MSNETRIYNELQKQARTATQASGRKVTTEENLTRHALESFLDRLTSTDHADEFVLKGGILLAAYGARRPTKDVDAEAVSALVSAPNVADVVRAVAAVERGDGLVFDVEAIDIQEIREDADYPGLRVRVPVSLATWRGRIAWDISTGDPIVPAPQVVTVPRILGESIEILGYAPETVLAEKAVTILERGTTSTRWRDYVDIVRLAEIHRVDDDQFLDSARAVASYRRVELTPVEPLLVGYGAIAQAKWAAWRRKEGFEQICREDLDEQIAGVCNVVDPVFSRAVDEDSDLAIEISSAEAADRSPQPRHASGQYGSKPRGEGSGL